MLCHICQCHLIGLLCGEKWVIILMKYKEKIMMNGFVGDGTYLCGTGLEHGELGNVFIESAKDWRKGARFYCYSEKCSFETCCYKNPPTGNDVPSGLIFISEASK